MRVLLVAFVVHAAEVVELDRLHIYPTVPIIRTADGEADCDCYRLST